MFVFLVVFYWFWLICEGCFGCFGRRAYQRGLVEILEISKFLSGIFVGGGSIWAQYEPNRRSLCGPIGGPFSYEGRGGVAGGQKSIAKRLKGKHQNNWHDLRPLHPSNPCHGGPGYELSLAMFFFVVGRLVAGWLVGWLIDWLVVLSRAVDRGSTRWKMMKHDDSSMRVHERRKVHSTICTLKCRQWAPTANGRGDGQLSHPPDP